MFNLDRIANGSFVYRSARMAVASLDGRAAAPLLIAAVISRPRSAVA